jgi:hypothetical protein
MGNWLGSFIKICFYGGKEIKMILAKILVFEGLLQPQLKSRG